MASTSVINTLINLEKFPEIKATAKHATTAVNTILDLNDFPDLKDFTRADNCPPPLSTLDLYPFDQFAEDCNRLIFPSVDKCAQAVVSGTTPTMMPTMRVVGMKIIDANSLDATVERCKMHILELNKLAKKNLDLIPPGHRDFPKCDFQISKSQFKKMVRRKARSAFFQVGKNKQKQLWKYQCLMNIMCQKLEQGRQYKSKEIFNLCGLCQFDNLGSFQRNGLVKCAAQFSRRFSRVGSDTFVLKHKFVV